ncbi:MAG: P-type Ca2+ transporter type [Thermotogaceae bacterium]|jgi:Ca2+-transporting ATPase|nr:P-type Ca2+ transporter type [Thermotogaceae bacterium]
MDKQQWHTYSIEETAEKLDTDLKSGIQESVVQQRLEEYGKNELEEKKGRNPIKIFLMQFTSTIVIVLLVAAVITGIIGELRDTIVISIILIINALIGFSQEYRAEKAMSTLKKLSIPKVRVKRSGTEKVISSTEIVPGDIVFLEAGNYVPADMRLIDTHNLKIQESALTGESQPVEKDADEIFEKDADLAVRKNMAYSGTVVSYGRAVGIVVRTGMKTEIGKIAAMLQEDEEGQTPMQKRLDKLGRILAFASLVIVVVIFLMGVLRGEDLKVMFMTAVSFAVAAVPEGLPTVVTIALALGARRMLSRNALVRRLMAVETLGSVNVICSDKTGTITENRMRVTVLELAGNRLDFGKEDADDPDSLPDDDQSALSLMLLGGSMCNDARLEPSKKRKGDFDVIGDPTEGALVYVAKKVDMGKDEYTEIFPRINEIPFESERKMMSTVHDILFEQLDKKNTRIHKYLKLLDIDHNVAFTKGAVDQLIKNCNHVLDGDEIFELDDQWKKKIMEEHDKLAKNGMRVLGIAYKNVDYEIDEDYEYKESDMTFIGMFGMMDPEREGVKEAIATAKDAGIRSIMITGDHPLTAGYIAQKLNMIENREEVILGRELEGRSDDEIDQIVKQKSVYARVTPENKVTIVKSLQRQGKTVSMTGDGVNDAPALKRADIGLAMGITGTDVSKEVSDMVLLDDNFSTIVAAVKEGRTIYDNIQKFIQYILASNMAEIWIMLLGPFLGIPLPLLPLQILWVNLISDGLPALSLSVEPAEKNIMKRKPNPINGNIIGTKWIYLILTGLIIAIFTLIPSLSFKNSVMEEGTWRTVLFSILVFSQLFFTFCIRSHKSVFKHGSGNNPYLYGAVGISFLLQLVVIYVPFFQDIFGTTALKFSELMISLLFSSLILWLFEIIKLFNKDL